MSLSPAHGDLLYSLTNHYFGNTAAKIIRTLFDFDQATLRVIKSNLPDVKLADLKKSLLTLVKYQLIDYVKTVKVFHQYEYSVVPQRAFAFFRISRFVYNLNQSKGSRIACLLSCLTERGPSSRENLVQAVSGHLNQESGDANSLCDFKIQLKDLIEGLVARNYFVEQGKNLCLNIERFNRDYRNNIIVDTVHVHYNRDNRIKALFALILDHTIDNTADDAIITPPITTRQLQTSLVPTEFDDCIQLDKYLSRLTSESNNKFLVTCGVHPGGDGPMYAVNIGLVIDFLVKEHLSSIVTTRFGPRCCRVFRLLLLRGPLLLKQIEECVMLPARDVREYSYRLIKEGFIKNRQVPKTPDNAPGKSIFVMSIDIDRVVSTAADLCCRSISNLLARYEFELNANRTLLERSKAVQDLLGSTENITTNGSKGTDDPTMTSLDDQEAWHQYFNNHELSELARFNSTLDRILLAKTQVDETLILLHSWLELRPNLFDTVTLSLTDP